MVEILVSPTTRRLRTLPTTQFRPVRGERPKTYREVLLRDSFSESGSKIWPTVIESAFFFSFHFIYPFFGCMQENGCLTWLGKSAGSFNPRIFRRNETESYFVFFSWITFFILYFFVILFRSWQAKSRSNQLCTKLSHATLFSPSQKTPRCKTDANVIALSFYFIINDIFYN